MSPSSFPDTAFAQLQGLRQKDFSAQELLAHTLAAVGSEPFNAFTSVLAAPVAPSPSGPLAGLPIAHKDVFCTRELPTTCGSKMLAGYLSPFDATVVEKLAAAGTITVGKTNMDEFAMGSSNENSHFGPVSNPWDTERVPGGSSGGSACAVAAGLVAVATGTDTGGSIRQPAAFCGITGLKPTYGRVSRWGMVAYASSLDQGGLLAHDARDIALLLPHITGLDPRDSTSAAQPVPDFSAGIEQSLQGLRIGLPLEMFSDQADARMLTVVREAAATLESLGATLHEVRLPHLQHAVPAYYVIAPAEASANLSRFDGIRFGHRCEHPEDLFDLYCRTRSEGFGEEVKRRILIGTFALSAGYFDAYYRQAMKVRRLVRNDFLQAFEQVDLLLSPVTPSVAFRKGEKTADPVQMYLEDIFTVPVSLAGLPALSMPCGLIEGLPAGVQLIGPDFQEARILNAAHRYQQATDWHLLRPGGSA